MSAKRKDLHTQEWRRISRQVQERDENQCVVCGSSDDLTVDHIKPVSLFDQEDWNAELQHNMNNLATMCRACNGRKAAGAMVRINYRNPHYFPDSS